MANAVGVEEDAALFGGRLEEVGDADAEDTFLVVVEDDFGEGRESDGHVDGANGLTAEFGVGEDVVGRLFEDVVRRSAVVQVDSVVSSPEVVPLFAETMRSWSDGAVFGTVGGLDGVGVIPEVEVVDVAVVEPESGVVGMVDSFAGEGLEGKAASDGGAVGCDERVEDGLALVGVPEVGGEGLAVDGDVDAMVGFVRDDLRRPWPACRLSGECRAE